MKKQDEPKKTRIISLRVPGEVYRRVQALAEENTRSMSQQSEHMLKLALELLESTGGVDQITVVREKLAGYGADKKGGGT